MAVMTTPKKPLKNKAVKALIAKEVNFLKGIFSSLSLPSHMSDDADDEFIYKGTNGDVQDEAPTPAKRAKTITELEERLEKIKSQNNFNLKTKLMKKSLTSKLNKKLKKRERLNKNKVKSIEVTKPPKQEPEEKPSPNIAKPVFNTDGKLVFSKFDFANTGHRGKVQKVEKDPKKILENLEKQEEKLRQLAEKDGEKVKEVKEKISWKNVLQKAEGVKVKDDRTLLKKSIKKIEQKKKHSKKKWDSRTQAVEQKKEDRQKKRKENIGKKKKEKKTKVIKAATKRGRVVI